MKHESASSFMSATPTWGCVCARVLVGVLVCWLVEAAAAACQGRLTARQHPPTPPTQLVG